MLFFFFPLVLFFWYSLSKLPPEFFVNTDIWLKNTCLHPSVAEGNRRHIVGLGTTLQPTGSQFKGSSLSVPPSVLSSLGEHIRNHISTLTEDSGAHQEQGCHVRGLEDASPGQELGPSCRQYCIVSSSWSALLGVGGGVQRRKTCHCSLVVCCPVGIRHTFKAHEQDIINNHERLHQPLPPLLRDEHSRQTRTLLPRHKSRPISRRFRSY